MNHVNQIFNLMKLPEYVPLFKGKRVAIAGVGAVGSYLAEIFAMMGVGEIWVFDFDRFENDNFAKCSGMIDPKRDTGRPKAQAVAERTQERMIAGGKCFGIHADLRCYGPMAFAGFDAVFIALDNYAAKELVNQNILQIPQVQRPVVGMAGTSGESAVAVLMDGGEFCLRCLFDESWLENSDIRTSCAGPQYMQIEGVDEIVRTSGLASLIAAALLAEKFRAWTLGTPYVMNTRTSYTPYPNLELLDTAPMRKRGCPDCRSFRAPEMIWPLMGSVLNLTLEEALRQITSLLGREDYELQVHLMRFKELSYGGYIVNEFCHHCGKPVSVYAHESRVHFEDILCEECMKADRFAFYNAERPVEEVMRYFAPDVKDEKLLGSSLYDLGYPIGTYLYVTCPDDAGGERRYCFSCMGDQEAMQSLEQI
ncbi:MAG: ThiF family adenylyltransferase [Oscillospiraceae bacterium]|nr:ThiF family adenylyltransferase [Oscillospiraceae bacterium]